MLDTLIDVLVVSTRINLGADYLDEVIAPDWHDDIDLNRLDLRDCKDCVLGQLTSSYMRVVDGDDEDIDSPRWWLETETHRYGVDNDRAATLLGFNSGDDDDIWGYDLLNMGWATKVSQRRQA